MADDLGVLVAKLSADVTDLKRGLLEGKQQLASFQSVVESAGAKITEVLRFAGVSLGFYEVISKLKEFGASVLDAGAKAEVLRGAMYAIGQHYEISAGSLDLYVKKLTEMGVLQENALQGINNFLKAGVSIDLLPQLAAAAKDLAPSMAMPFNEAFAAIIQAVTKGTPKALAELTPGIKQALQAASSATKQMIDSSIMSGTERTQVMVDFVLQAAEKVKGAGDAVSGSYLKQLQDYKIAAHEAKEALFEIVKPISMAITGQEIKSWQDFYVWIVNNKKVLQDLSEVVVVYVERIANTTRAIVSFITTHKDLAKTLLEVYLISKTVGWFTGIVAGAALAEGAIVGVSGSLKALLALCGGPWKVVITIALFGLYEAYRAIQALRAEAGFTPKPFQVAGALQEGRARDNTAMDKATSASNLGGEAERRGVSSDALEALVKENTRLRAEGKPMKPLPQVLAANETPEERYRREAAAAAAKGKAENALPPKAGKGKSGGAASEEDILGEHMKALEAQRKADLAAAEDQIQILKATQDKKKALLDQDLATGLIDGATYYTKLKEMQEAETTAALALIDQKRKAQKAAYQDELTVLQQQQAQGKFSPEMGAEKNAILAAKNRQEVAKLDVEAAKLRLDNEKKITDELTKQLELKKQYTQKTEDLNVETAQLMGAISSQEATLQKLYLDWQRTKQEAFKAGVMDPNSPAFVPGYGAALDKNLEAKKADTLYGGYAAQITQGISSLADALMSGGQDLQKTANSMFKGLFNEAMKPGLEQLKQLLVSGFKDLFGSAGGAIANSVMGAIGLIGMMLTSGGGKSSFTSSGVQSAVTGHEAVRGIIAGDTSLPIAQIGTSLSEALLPTNGILSQIESNTRGGGGGGGGVGVSVDVGDLVPRVKEAIQSVMEEYFRDVYMQSSRA